ncbi:hypothetical protein FRC04_007640 [Tulasnella sp. 424]|nr:hypothetical protein FRC04_007640 [Tulasnella sp. 424]
MAYRVIREKAQAVGEKVRSENGVATAIQSLYMYLHRAGIRPEHKRSKSSAVSQESEQQQQHHQQPSTTPAQYAFFQVACETAASPGRAFSS